MKADNETGFWRETREKLRTAPSLRVPVTAANRELLRRLRAAELFAWETGRAVAASLGEKADARNLSSATQSL